MNDSKLHFSESEMELVCNADVILTKNIIMQKMRQLLAVVSNEMVSISSEYPTFSEHLNLFNVPPKISRGENYLGLPYLILDYPRNFLHDNFFAVRSFFWWGNFFSSTLHLSGNHRTRLLNKIINNYEKLVHHNYYINNNIDPWQHHFQGNNVVLIKNLSVTEFKKLCNENEHLKFSSKWSLTEWNSAQQNFIESWKFFLSILFDQAPKR
jgi:hypothetical protein